MSWSGQPGVGGDYSRNGLASHRTSRRRASDGLICGSHVRAVYQNVEYDAEVLSRRQGGDEKIVEAEEKKRDSKRQKSLSCVASTVAGSNAYAVSTTEYDSLLPISGARWTTFACVQIGAK